MSHMNAVYRHIRQEDTTSGKVRVTVPRSDGSVDTYLVKRASPVEITPSQVSQSLAMTGYGIKLRALSILGIDIRLLVNCRPDEFTKIATKLLVEAGKAQEFIEFPEVFNSIEWKQNA